MFILRLALLITIASSLCAPFRNPFKSSRIAPHHTPVFSDIATMVTEDAPRTRTRSPRARTPRTSVHATEHSEVKAVPRGTVVDDSMRGAVRKALHARNAADLKLRELEGADDSRLAAEVVRRIRNYHATTVKETRKQIAAHKQGLRPQYAEKPALLMPGTLE